MAKINLGSDVCRIPWFDVNMDIRFDVHPDVVMDICALGFKKHCAEEINIGNTLEHLEEKDVKRALMECLEILAPQGVLFITLPLIDKAEECFMKGEIDTNRLESIRNGEGDGYNSHKMGFRTGDLERILDECGFVSQSMDLRGFPYLVVSDNRNPKPDSWQYGVKAHKK